MIASQYEGKIELKPLFLTDLDDTLFTTARKIKGVPIELCTVASTLTDGSPSGYRTPAHRALMQLMEVGDIVPVTARSREVMARCDVPQAPAICSNGGVIVLADGRIDQDWHDEIVTNVGDRTEIDGLHEQVRQVAGAGFRNWTVDESGTPLYICFKNDASDEDAIERLALDIEDGSILPEGWSLHRNGNNLALMPVWISKRRAARHLIARVRSKQPNRLVIGLGDSLSDLGFMAECDYAMHPTHSQIGRHLAKGHQW